MEKQVFHPFLTFYPNTYLFSPITNLFPPIQPQTKQKNLNIKFLGQKIIFNGVGGGKSYLWINFCCVQVVLDMSSLPCGDGETVSPTPRPYQPIPSPHTILSPSHSPLRPLTLPDVQHSPASIGKTHFFRETTNQNKHFSKVNTMKVLIQTKLLSV